MKCELCQGTGLVFIGVEDVERGFHETEEAYRCNCELGNKYQFAKSIEKFPFWRSLKNKRIEAREINQSIKNIKETLQMKSEPSGENKELRAIRKKVDGFGKHLKKLIVEANLLDNIHRINPTPQTRYDLDAMTVKLEIEEIRYLGYLRILDNPEAIEDIKIEIRQRIEEVKKQLESDTNFRKIST